MRLFGAGDCRKLLNEILPDPVRTVWTSPANEFASPGASNLAMSLIISDVRPHNRKRNAIESAGRTVLKEVDAIAAKLRREASRQVSDEGLKTKARALSTLSKRLEEAQGR